MEIHRLRSAVVSGSYLHSYPAQTNSVAHFSLAYLPSSTSCRRQRDVIETTVLARMHAQFKEFMVSLMVRVKGSCCSVFFPLVFSPRFVTILGVIAGAIVNLFCFVLVLVLVLLL